MVKASDERVPRPEERSSEAQPPPLARVTSVSAALVLQECSTLPALVDWQQESSALPVLVAGQQDLSTLPLLVAGQQESSTLPLMVGLQGLPTLLLAFLLLPVLLGLEEGSTWLRGHQESTLQLLLLVLALLLLVLQALTGQQDGSTLQLLLQKGLQESPTLLRLFLALLLLLLQGLQESTSLLRLLLVLMGQEELPTAAQVMTTEALPVLLMDWSTSAACWAKMFLLPLLLVAEANMFCLLLFLLRLLAAPEGMMRQQLL